MRTPGPALWSVATVLYGFLYAPIAVVVVLSFNAARHGIHWEGFTLHWYAALWNNPVALSAARNTLVLGSLSTLISTVVGTGLGYALARHPIPGRRTVDLLLRVPIFIPDIVMAVGMLLLYSAVRQATGFLQLGMGAMVLGHVTFQIPFVAVVIRSRLAGMDPALEEAAHDLGANAWQTFRFVTLPLLAPGVLGAAMLAFTLSLDDFSVSFFTSGPGSTTLPILIYSSVKRSVTPDIHALSTLIVLASLFGAVAAAWLGRRRGAAPQ
jgi:spermidine/putrescine transport system permease protein